MGDNMAYSLMVENTMDNKKHYINVYDRQKKAYSDKVNLWDIDLFTSSYSNERELLEHLKNTGQIDFSSGRVYIEKISSENFSLYLPIFNSTIIKEAANSVEDANIRTSMIREYSNFTNNSIPKFIDINDDIINKKMNVNKDFKNYLSKYNETKVKYQENGWRNEVYNDLINYDECIRRCLIQYKAFREFYSVIDQYEKNKCTKDPVSYNLYKKYIQQMKDNKRYKQEMKVNNKNNSSKSDSNKNEDKNKNNKTEELKEMKETLVQYWNASNVNTGNLDKEEFLSEEECEEAYSDYHRGAK